MPRKIPVNRTSPVKPMGPIWEFFRTDLFESLSPISLGFRGVVSNELDDSSRSNAMMRGS